MIKLCMSWRGFEIREGQNYKTRVCSRKLVFDDSNYKDDIQNTLKDVSREYWKIKANRH